MARREEGRVAVIVRTRVLVVGRLAAPQALCLAGVHVHEVQEGHVALRGGTATLHPPHKPGSHQPQWRPATTGNATQCHLAYPASQAPSVTRSYLEGRQAGARHPDAVPTLAHHSPESTVDSRCGRQPDKMHP